LITKHDFLLSLFLHLFGVQSFASIPFWVIFYTTPETISLTYIKKRKKKGDRSLKKGALPPSFNHNFSE